VAESLPPRRILLVEDSEANRFLVLAYLKNTNYRVDIAENGLIALEKFKSNPYDLVLMDLEMPEMDGYTATREFRTWEAENARRLTPVIALTAHAFKEYERKSREAGCTTHLTKPIEKYQLLAAIRNFIG
jgi:CheY-like chemotaxis protein